MMAGHRMLVSVLLTSFWAPNSRAQQPSPSTSIFTDPPGGYLNHTPAMTVTVPTNAVDDSESNTNCRLMSTPTASDPGYIYTPTYYPTAPGTLEDCVTYRNFTDPTNLYFYSDLPDRITTGLNSCIYIARSNQVTMDQLMEWNPSLSGNMTTCALQPGYSYCVLKSEDSVIPPYTSSYCLSINATEPTTVSNCNCLTQVNGYMSGDYTCENIIEDLNITEAELLAWNPWLSSDCDTNLYANITGNDMRAVCIGIDTNATTTTSSTSAAPTPADIVSGHQEL